MRLGPRRSLPKTLQAEVRHRRVPCPPPFRDSLIAFPHQYLPSGVPYSNLSTFRPKWDHLAVSFARWRPGEHRESWAGEPCNCSKMNGNVTAQERPTKFLGWWDLRFLGQRVQLSLVGGGERFLASRLDDPDQSGQHVDGLRHLIEHAVASVGPVIVADRFRQPVLYLGELA